jgi:hypothetical protein
LVVPLSTDAKIAVAGVVFGATLIIFLVLALRDRYLSLGWKSWPTAEATVEDAKVRAFKGGYWVDIGYSFSVDNSFVTGWDQRNTSGQAEAEAYAANIRGQKVVIRFNPKNPERSRIDDDQVASSAGI